MSREYGKLTTTSYAVLGLLAIKPWTTYELIQQIGRGVDRLWPRSRSKLFEEPKKLVAHGLAEASPGRVGKRPRTRYAITDDGRQALSDWLAIQSQLPLLESEHLLKVFFAEQGTKENLRNTIGACATGPKKTSPCTPLSPAATSLVWGSSQSARRL